MRTLADNTNCCIACPKIIHCCIFNESHKSENEMNRLCVHLFDRRVPQLSSDQPIAFGSMHLYFRIAAAMQPPHNRDEI